MDVKLFVVHEHNGIECNSEYDYYFTDIDDAVECLLSRAGLWSSTTFFLKCAKALKKNPYEHVTIAASGEGGYFYNMEFFISESIVHIGNRTMVDIHLALQAYDSNAEEAGKDGDVT